MKKLVSMLLVLAMLLGCSGISLAEDEVKAFDENITLTIAVFDRGVAGGNAPDNNYWTDYIQKNFGDPRNITIKWVTIPRSEEISKLNMLMSSGEAPDICFTYTESAVTNFVSMGGLYELSELIDTYGANIKRYLGDEILSAGIFEGGQYAIPARRIVTAGFSYFVRGDMLEDMGMDMPENKQEFHEMLTALKNTYNIAPLNITTSNFSVKDSLMMSFIKDLSERNLACTPAVCWDGFEDYLTYMNQLFNEGLIDPDFALDDARYTTQIPTSASAVYTMHYDDPIRANSTLTTLQSYTPDATLDVLDCFESAADPTVKYHPVQAAYGMLCIVPITSQHPDAAVMYLDWLCREDVINDLQNGVEGINYTLNEDGLPVIQTATDNWYFMNSSQNVDYTLTTNGQYFSDPEKLLAVQALSYAGDFDEIFPVYYETAMRNPLDVVFHFDVVIESEATYGAYLTSLFTEMITKCIMCDPAELHDLYESYVQQYLNEGGQAVWDEKTAAWDKAHS